MAPTHLLVMLVPLVNLNCKHRCPALAVVCGILLRSLASVIQASQVLAVCSPWTAMAVV